MAITLTSETLPARSTKHGSTSVTLAAGKVLKIETSPRGEELLQATVPVGKSWVVAINVHVVETDA